MRADRHVTKDWVSLMRKETIEKSVITLILVVWWLFMPQIGYTPEDTDNIKPHLFYLLSHANFMHLFGNLFVLWIMKRELYVIPSIIIAVLVSLIPAWSLWGDLGMTMGFSGVLFAIYGIKWGVYATDRYGMHYSASARDKFLIKAVPFALIGAVIPHLNWCIHLYALLAGYIYGRFKRQ